MLASSRAHRAASAAPQPKRSRGAGSICSCVCRDRARAERAAVEIAADAPRARVESRDRRPLADRRGRARRRRDPRRASADRSAAEQRGRGVRDRRESADGIEYTFALNHLAYFQLTLRLLEQLRASAPSRVVNVASDAYTFAKGRFDFADYAARTRISPAAPVRRVEARQHPVHARARAAARGQRRRRRGVVAARPHGDALRLRGALARAVRDEADAAVRAEDRRRRDAARRSVHARELPPDAERALLLREPDGRRARRATTRMPADSGRCRRSWSESEACDGAGRRLGAWMRFRLRGVARGGSARARAEEAALAHSRAPGCAIERERDDAARDAAIVRATEPLSFAFRGFARGVMRRRMVPAERYVIEPGASAPTDPQRDTGAQSRSTAARTCIEKDHEVTSRHRRRRARSSRRGSTARRATAPRAGA